LKGAKQVDELGACARLVECMRVVVIEVEVANRGVGSSWVARHRSGGIACELEAAQDPGRRRTRGQSLEGLRPTRADANVREDEVTVLAAKLLTALLARRKRTSVLLAGKLLLAGTLLRVETIGLLDHHP
jgi:hypothetical protein